MTMAFESLPGGDLVEKGLRDIERGELSIEGLLVAIGAPRLSRAGVRVPASPVESPELALYRRLAEEDSRTAYSRYKALLARLVSFERALEFLRSRAVRKGEPRTF